MNNALKKKRKRHTKNCIKRKIKCSDIGVSSKGNVLSARACAVPKQKTFKKKKINQMPKKKANNNKHFFLDPITFLINLHYFLNLVKAL